jgi:hypothetical protein
MRGFLPLAFCFVLASTLLLPTAATQQRAQNELPDPASFPAAGPNCQRRMTLSPWVGTPASRTPGKFHCVFSLTTCRESLTVTSDERDSGTDMCADYWKVHGALASREICCDQDAATETPTPQPSPGEKPPDTKCAPSLPWFGGSNCKSEPKDPLITVSGGTATLHICGQPVFYNVEKSLLDSLFSDAYRAALRDHVQGRIRGKICCDEFEEAVKTGHPCNPKDDVDCDGIPNKTDLVKDANYLPDINAFTKPEEATVDFYPSDYFDAQRLPKTSECACKWELVKAELKCSLDGKEQHLYVARWRCPSTKREDILVNYAPASTPCEK